MRFFAMSSELLDLSNENWFDCAEWPSDDSNDSDYEEKPPVKKEKESHSSRPNCTVSLASGGVNNGHNNDKQPIKLIFSNCIPKKKVSNEREIKRRRFKTRVYDARVCHDIPRELLYDIFKMVIKSEGVVPFIPRASKVCRLWNEVVNDPRLWIKADLSSGRVKRSEESLKWLCQNHLTATKELNLSGWGKMLSAYGIQAISDHCSQLSSINLSRCSKLTNLSMKILIDRCKNLSSFDLTAVTECSGSSQSSPVSTSTLSHLIQSCGSNLKELYLASNYLLSLQVPLSELYSKCDNLTVLDLSNMKPEGRSVTINLEKLQVGCPKLQVLRLANTIVQLSNATVVEQNAAPGFPDLEELSIAVCRKSSWMGFNESALERLVKCSKKLRLLDLRGCSHTASSIVRIPAWDIEHLYLSRCEATKHQGLELIIQKWGHSLVVLDLSWSTTPDEIIDEAVIALAGVGEKSNLQELDLRGSTVSFEPIQVLLKNSPRLRCLDLSSCRGLPRGIKRLYQSKEDVDILRRDYANCT
ncbi:F-box/LRR-repeat protein 6 [Nymphon striatum]|nr:F-box/LRR-repeat protein 6 [Nymphon striatum]